MPAQLANTVLAGANNAAAVGNQFIDALSRRPPELNTYKMNVADFTRATTQLWGVTDNAQAYSRAAHQLRKSASTPTNRPTESLRPRTILGVHPVKTGDTMQSISQRWYKNPDQTDAICRANRLPLDTVIPTRAVLVIPVAETTTTN
jgi:LysM repeat protein